MSDYIDLSEMLFGDYKVTNVSVVKYVLRAEAKKLGINIFTEYVREVEIEDIIRDILIHVKKELKSLDFEVNEETIEAYLAGIGNEEILKALV